MKRERMDRMTMSENEAAGDAIRTLVEAFVSAWNRHDASAFAATFAEDADFTNVFGMAAKGRREVENFHAPIFRTMFKDSRLTPTETRIRFIRPDVATVDVRWEMVGACDPHGNAWPMRRGLIDLVVTAAGDAWSIDVMHNMDLPSADFANAQAALSKP